MVASLENELLSIGCHRLCSCPPKHLNCMTAKEWILSQLGVWKFAYESRDIRDKKAHPATFPIALAKRCISLFTHQGELVLDPFVGSGTTLVAARDLNRSAVGFDLKQEYTDLSASRLGAPNGNAASQQMVCHDDARNVDLYLEPDSVSLIFTSPPYANLLNRPRLNKSRRSDERGNEQFLKIEQYSQDTRDLGTLGLSEYQEAMAQIFQGLLPLLRSQGHCLIDVPDMWQDNQRVTIHMAVVDGLPPGGDQ